jgi:NRPS condensation-like uncharacterized protein
MTNSRMVNEMCRRVGLSAMLGQRIRLMALSCAIKNGHEIDMTLVARAIKYAGDNKHLLKKEYQ